MVNVLYIHGMGGGADSRIPSILSEEFAGTDVRVVVRTYDFDPEIAESQISGWVDEFEPSLIIGESLGFLHALRITCVPRILVSPAMNAPQYFAVLSWLTMLPFVSRYFDRLYKPREGDRQIPQFKPVILKKYLPYRKSVLHRGVSTGKGNPCYAFFGTKDHFRRSGIVSIRTWKKYFGDSFSIYDGSHFMEDEYVRTELKFCIENMLAGNK